MMRLKHWIVYILLISVFTVCQKTVSPEDSLNDVIQALIKVPQTRQATGYTCGVAALQSLLYYYGDEWRQDRLEKALDADSTNGTNYRNIVTFCQDLGYTTNLYFNLSLDSLKSMINRDIPVMLAIQAWADLPIDYKNEWESGHYVICIGYDQDRFYFMDPSTIDNYTYIPTSEFIDRWHDIDQEGIRLYSFGLTIFKGTPSFNPENIPKLE
ncbi:MAG: C39 family peptidase [Candidatus Delongbacteria bacterium]|nr:C39 family peptidase [Candidatus Delongbacteria bacterium]